MRNVPSHMTEVWQSENKVGDSRRPVVRATIQRAYLRRWAYDTAMALGGDLDHDVDQHRTGAFTSMIFGNPYTLREMRSIRSCSWTRGVDQDVATCSLTLLNSDLTPIGNPDEDDMAGFDLPGYFTSNRGKETISENRWGYRDNGWTDVFVPDALVKTYEGYGINRSVPAYDDENLVQTGVWLVDTVTYSSDGTITLEMRDLGRLLLDQIAYPPVIPYSEYPMFWSHLRTEQVPGRDVTGGRWRELRGLATARSSNDYYIGRGIQNGGVQYVDARGGVYGHHASDALVNTGVYADKKKKKLVNHYWMSTAQKHQDDLVWWQADLKDHTTALNGLRIQTRGQCYIYISLMGKDGWIGRKRIPYDSSREGLAGGVDINADIPFVMKVKAEPSKTFDVTLPRKYADIRKIRLTFSFLGEWSYGKPLSFHAILRDLQIYTAKNAAQLGFKKGKILKTVGNYTDYSTIVQMVCAWAGFFHPDVESGDDWIKLGYTGTNSGKTFVHLRKRSKALPRGGLWGNVMPSHTHGLADLTSDLFDKKPLMDMINYIRDLLGFHFYIDEVGAVNFRMSNIWEQGNYLFADPLEPRELEDAKYHQRRTKSYVTLDENNSLFEYSTILSSEAVRERIFVANSLGRHGTVIKGYNPVPTGMRRVAGWTDQHFGSKRETVVMADMVAARAMFAYKRGSAKIAGYPRIQVDDQIRIFERVTNETFFHRVMNISSNLDMDGGTWDYDVETHWLGEDPDTAWVIKVDELQGATKAYLALLK